jgi:hypothetical protein
LRRWFSRDDASEGDARAKRFLPSEARRAFASLGCRQLPPRRLAFANSTHRDRINRPQRENRSDAARLEMCAPSGPDGARASPLHAPSLGTSPENPSKPETRWRIRQSDANCSLGSKFPDHQGKNRDFLRFPRRIGAVEARKAIDPQGFFQQIPYSREQGNIFG